MQIRIASTTVIEKYPGIVFCAARALLLRADWVLILQRQEDVRRPVRSMQSLLAVCMANAYALRVQELPKKAKFGFVIDIESWNCTSEK